MTYPLASSMKSVTELRNCCPSGKSTGPKAAGFVSAALLASHCAHAQFFCIPMAHASNSPVHKLKLPAFAKLARSWCPVTSAREFLLAALRTGPLWLRAVIELLI